MNVCFKAAAVAVTLILLGQFLEARAKGRVSQAISRLVGLRSRMARVHRGGTVVEVPIAQVRTGDLLDLCPGQWVPVDGKVTAGDRWLDRSMITGEAADVVLMSGRLTGVPDAIALSRATMGNIRQNLCLAFAYNAALIPVAARVLYPAIGILLSPVFAAGVMELASVFALGNTLRLRRVQPNQGKKDRHEHRRGCTRLGCIGQDDPLP